MDSQSGGPTHWFQLPRPELLLNLVHERRRAGSLFGSSAVADSVYGSTYSSVWMAAEQDIEITVVSICRINDLAETEMETTHNAVRKSNKKITKSGKKITKPRKFLYRGVSCS